MNNVTSMANNTTCTSYAINIHVFFCLPHLENLVDLFRRKLDVFICRITIAAIFNYSLNAYCETPGPSYKKTEMIGSQNIAQRPPPKMSL